MSVQNEIIMIYDSALGDKDETRYVEFFLFSLNFIFTRGNLWVAFKNLHWIFPKSRLSFSNMYIAVPFLQA